MNTQIRSPSLAWNLTLEQSKDIERIEKRAIRIIHPQYEYNQALVVSNLKTLKERRDDLCVGLIKYMLQPTHRLHTVVYFQENLETLRRGRSVLIVRNFITYL